MSKNTGEKLVVLAGALGLLVLGYRSARLLLTGAALIREKLANTVDNAKKD